MKGFLTPFSNLKKFLFFFSIKALNMKLKKFDYYYILDNVMSRITNFTSLPLTAAIIFASFLFLTTYKKKNVKK